jgi:hypothetical protein
VAKRTPAKVCQRQLLGVASEPWPICDRTAPLGDADKVSRTPRATGPVVVITTPSIGARYRTVEACFPRLSTYSGMRFISRLGEGGR